MQNETEIADKIVEMTETLVSEEQEYLEGQNSDPLIDLKQQELNLRAQEIAQKKDIEEKKLDLDAEKLNFDEEKLEQKEFWTKKNGPLFITKKIRKLEMKLLD